MMGTGGVQPKLELTYDSSITIMSTQAGIDNDFTSNLEDYPFFDMGNMGYTSSPAISLAESVAQHSPCPTTPQHLTHF